MLGMENWQETLNGLSSGKAVEVTPEVWDYFLEVLPPVFMGKKIKLEDGTEVAASFGFAEGAEKIKAFWQKDGKYFAGQTGVINPCW
jgi:hypothetical protein